MPLNWENRSRSGNATASWVQCSECGGWMRMNYGMRDWHLVKSPIYHTECLERVETRRLVESMDWAVNGHEYDGDYDDWR